MFTFFVVIHLNMECIMHLWFIKLTILCLHWGTCNYYLCFTILYTLFGILHKWLSNIALICNNFSKTLSSQQCLLLWISSMNEHIQTHICTYVGAYLTHVKLSALRASATHDRSNEQQHRDYVTLELFSPAIKHERTFCYLSLSD